MDKINVDVVRMNANIDDVVHSDADNDIIESHLTTEGTIRYTQALKQSTSRQDASTMKTNSFILLYPTPPPL